MTLLILIIAFLLAVISFLIWPESIMIGWICKNISPFIGHALCQIGFHNPGLRELANNGVRQGKCTRCSKPYFTYKDIWYKEKR